MLHRIEHIPARIGPDKHSWVAKLLGRMSKKQAAIAIANKTSRIAWAIIGGVYEARLLVRLNSSQGVRGCRQHHSERNTP